MTRYRNALPQLGNELFLTDAGAETTLITRVVISRTPLRLICFRPKGTAALHQYFTTYAKLAKQFGVGLVIAIPTWRASANGGTRLGYTSETLNNTNWHEMHLTVQWRLLLCLETRVRPMKHPSILCVP
ncbi:MAG: homocysteine S-methyltransferase [Chloroflexi bacterium AL-N10]|nr:homocysteine S-methyltransferase [Chloroflexi bacterium AL-N10]